MWWITLSRLSQFDESNLFGSINTATLHAPAISVACASSHDLDSGSRLFSSSPVASRGHRYPQPIWDGKRLQIQKVEWPRTIDPSNSFPVAGFYLLA